jgi:hypothetical protein
VLELELEALRSGDVQFDISAFLAVVFGCLSLLALPTSAAMPKGTFADAAYLKLLYAVECTLSEVIGPGVRVDQCQVTSSRVWLRAKRALCLGLSIAWLQPKCGAKKRRMWAFPFVVGSLLTGLMTLTYFGSIVDPPGHLHRLSWLPDPLAERGGAGHTG